MAQQYVVGVVSTLQYGRLRNSPKIPNWHLSTLSLFFSGHQKLLPWQSSSLHPM